MLEIRWCGQKLNGLNPPKKNTDHWVPQFEFLEKTRVVLPRGHIVAVVAVSGEVKYVCDWVSRPRITVGEDISNKPGPKKLDHRLLGSYKLSNDERMVTNLALDRTRIGLVMPWSFKIQPPSDPR